MAMYALALFYVECRDLLRPFNPVPKFIMIKSIIFLIGRVFWFFFTAKSRFIKSSGEAVDFQNCVLCVEILLATVGHLYAFPYKEYEGANIGASSNFTKNVAHALKFNDTVHQFAPTNHYYVLYNNNEVIRK